MALATTLDDLVLRARRERSLHLAGAVLRIFVGFSLFPAGLKKVLAEPFTDPHLHGPFHDFLHAFHATGAFYQLVGAVQLVAATLLVTQRFATLGALLAAPIFTTISALCWSTKVYPTASVVTLIGLGTLALLVWDRPAWRPVLAPRRAHEAPEPEPSIDRRLWQRSGVVILALYLAVCAATGGVYRPRGAAWDTPAFYVFPTMLLVVVATLFVDRARHAGAAARAPGSSG
ncbi:MAG: hypothetical protein KIS78_11255 [Labilithrix sp.]|nr:hypothetical protein [Labilithrix sp.]MCW5832977.1 hypothetical protein [Labilithrix sp.]